MGIGEELARSVSHKVWSLESLLISRPIIRAIAETLANPDVPNQLNLRPARNVRNGARAQSGA